MNMNINTTRYYDTDLGGGGIPDELRRKAEENETIHNWMDNRTHSAESTAMVKVFCDGYSLASEEMAEKIKNEPVNFFLVNALKHLTTEQIKTLSDSLYERIPLKMRQEEISRLKAENERLTKEVKRLKDENDDLHFSGTPLIN